MINNLLKQGSQILKKQNIISHQLEAELLLSKTIKKDRIFLLVNSEKEILSKKVSKYLNYILRRKKYEPIAYITKKKEFWSSAFKVNRDVLIPRPETEIIVEQVLKRFKSKDNINILDIGTGSGCILLSITKELKRSRGIGIDISSKAIKIAKINSKKLHLTRKTKFIHCNVDNFHLGNYDIIVSNPPYISSNKIRYLSEDIKEFEPKKALDGGSSGLEIINKVIIRAKQLLKTKGYLFIEIGNEQSMKVSHILHKNGFRLVDKFYDYTKTVRCIMSTKII